MVKGELVNHFARCTMKKLLVAVGFVFLVQSCFIATSNAFISRARDPSKPDAPATNLRLSLLEGRFGDTMSSMAGSLLACVGSWMLALYLKSRETDRRLADVAREMERLRDGKHGGDKTSVH